VGRSRVELEVSLFLALLSNEKEVGACDRLG